MQPEPADRTACALVLLGARFRCLDVVEYGFRGNILGNLAQVVIDVGCNAHPIGDFPHEPDQPGDLMLRRRGGLSGTRIPKEGLRAHR